MESLLDSMRELLLIDKDLEDKLSRVFINILENANSFAVSNRISKKQNHNGLGLSIVRSILDSYKGRITAENTEHGVLFTIIFPLK